MVDGAVYDKGASNPLNEGTEGHTHYNAVFIITDAAIDMSIGDFTTLVPGNATTIGISADLYSPGTSGFQTRTFTYVDSTATEADIADRFVFFAGEEEVLFDNNGVEKGVLDGPHFSITGGSITVTGSGVEDYTITYDVIVSGGKKLTGTYSRPFKEGFSK